MPTYTNPQTIDTGTQRSAAELQSNFDAIQGALNGGLDEVNVPNLAAAFTTWKDIVRVSGALAAGAGTATYVVNNGTYQVGAANSGFAAYYLDPSDYTANSRTTRYRIRWACLVNAVNTAATLTCGLSPVTAFGGASGALPTIGSVGAAVTGSTVAFTSPLASTNTVVLSSEFNAPSAGMYVFTVALSPGLAAGSSATIFAGLEMRQA